MGNELNHTASLRTFRRRGRRNGCSPYRRDSIVACVTLCGSFLLSSPVPVSTDSSKASMFLFLTNHDLLTASS